MNKIVKIIIAILAGIERAFYVLTPLILSVILVYLSSNYNLSILIILVTGGLASLFRGIKTGWINK